MTPVHARGRDLDRWTAAGALEGGWAEYVRNTRNIGDFTQWKNHDAFQQAFDRLLRDLRAEGAAPS